MQKSELKVGMRVKFGYYGAIGVVKEIGSTGRYARHKIEVVVPPVGNTWASSFPVGRVVEVDSRAIKFPVDENNQKIMTPAMLRSEKQRKQKQDAAKQLSEDVGTAMLRLAALGIKSTEGWVRPERGARRQQVLCIGAADASKIADLLEDASKKNLVSLLEDFKIPDEDDLRSLLDGIEV